MGKTLPNIKKPKEVAKPKESKLYKKPAASKILNNERLKNDKPNKWQT